MGIVFNIESCVNYIEKIWVPTHFKAFLRSLITVLHLSHILHLVRVIIEMDTT